MSMRWLISFLIAASIASAAPRLAVAIDQAITRPGRGGKGDLIRPLLLILGNRDAESPTVEASTFTGTVRAECHKLKSAAGKWDAEVRFEVTEAPGKAPLAGSVTLRLAIDDAIVRGSYEGQFNGIAMHGQPGAGLVFEHAYEQPNQGLILWMPHLRRPVRGIVISGNGGVPDNRYGALQQELQTIGAAEDLALVGTLGLNPSSGPDIVAGLKTLGEVSGHPELERAPIFFIGHSGGGRMAAEFNSWLPARTGGFASSHGGTALFHEDAAGLANPGVLTAGELDPKVGALGIEAGFVQSRLRGGHLCLVVEQGEDHAPGPGGMPLILYSLHHMIEERLPWGASQLLPVDESRAWLADNATWKSGITKIMPASEVHLEGPAGFNLGDHVAAQHILFEGLPPALRMSWISDKDVAYVYRGAATYSNPLKLARSGGHGATYLHDEAVELECTDFGNLEWKSISVYDGAMRVGEVNRERPKLKLAVHQRAGAHALVLVGETRGDELRTSLPVLVAVWP